MSKPLVGTPDRHDAASIQYQTDMACLAEAIDLTKELRRGQVGKL
ncbi:MAG: hypothetical protein ACXW4C_11415 [Nitrospira sp.]